MRSPSHFNYEISGNLEIFTDLRTKGRPLFPSSLRTPQRCRASPRRESERTGVFSGISRDISANNAPVLRAESLAFSPGLWIQSSRSHRQP